VAIDTIVGFFNGIHIILDDTLRDEEMKISVHKMWNDWDSDELLLVPKDYISMNAYNASFGHKLNHNSDNNVDAGYMDHPRFGRIRSIVTTKDLKAGQELFCEYAATVDGGTFVRQVFKDLANYMDIEEDDEKEIFLENMQNNVKVMTQSITHDPNKYYRKP
jgi:hypothetical protein